MHSDQFNSYLEALISQLPDNFSAAREIIKGTIVPLLVFCDGKALEYYIGIIAQHTQAPIDAVIRLIEESLWLRGAAGGFNCEADNDFYPAESRKSGATEQIARDPALFRRKIDIVQQLGAVGERRNIGIYQLAMDSRLIPMKGCNSEALALKNSGRFGSGKSYSLGNCLKIYPESAYHMITSGSAKSLYNAGDGLQHKALILAEAAVLEARNGKDSDLAYSIRSLLSEGQLKYQRTETVDGQRQTVTVAVPGPTSLITTTIRDSLEEQLDDRMLTIHPNTSPEQTARIIKMTAATAAGKVNRVDEQLLEAWKRFHESLFPHEVIVPFAEDVAEFLTDNPELPLSARRATSRIISAIKTVAIDYQDQRQMDEQGRLIAEYADYAIVFQLLEECSAQSLGNTKQYTDERVNYVATEGMVTSRAISSRFKISPAAVSKWLKPLIDKGVLIWCDVHGSAYSSIHNLEKAKHSGTAYLRVARRGGLPTPFELTGDPNWDRGGNLWKLYDLHLDDDDYVVNQVDSTGVNVFTENACINVEKGVRKPAGSQYSNTSNLAMLEYHLDNLPVGFLTPISGTLM